MDIWVILSWMLSWRSSCVPLGGDYRTLFIVGPFYKNLEMFPTLHWKTLRLSTTALWCLSPEHQARGGNTP